MTILSSDNFTWREWRSMIRFRYLCFMLVEKKTFRMSLLLSGLEWKTFISLPFSIFHPIEKGNAIKFIA